MPQQDKPLKFGTGASDRRPMGDDPDAHLEVGWLCGTLDRRRETMDGAKHGPKLDRRNSRALCSLIEVLRAARRFSEAGEAVRAAFELWPDDPDVHVEAGLLLDAQGRHQEAIDHADSALKLDPRNSGALRCRVAFLRNARRFSEAEEAAQEALDELPNEPEVHVEAGLLFDAQGRHQEAIDSYAKAGQRFKQLCRHQEAIACAKRVLKLDRRNPGALRSRVEFLRNARRFSEAEKAVQKALNKLPNDPEVHVEAGWLFDTLGRHQEAIACADCALKLDPEHPWALRSRVEFLWNAGEFEQADADARAALGLRLNDPDMKDMKLAAGRWLSSKLGRHQEAAGYAKRALELEPEDYWALRRQVEFLRRAGQLKQAKTAAKAMLDRHPSDPEVHVEAGWLFDTLGRHRKAIDCADRALELGPLNSWALRSRVEFLWKAGEFEQAEEAAQKALDLRPADPFVHVRAGWLNNARHKVSDALGNFETALLIDPYDPDALEEHTAALRKLYRFREAEQAAGEALSRLPRNPRLHTARGWVFGAQSRWDEALACVNLALELDPWNSWALRSRVEFLQGAGRLVDAEKAARTMVELRSDEPEVHVTAGWLFDELGRYQDAIGCADRALERDPRNSWALCSRVAFLRNARQFKQAEKAARAALKLRSDDDPDVHVTAGWLFDKLGRNEEAIACADCALKLDPEHPWALRSRVAFLRNARRFEQAEEAARAALKLRCDDPDMHVEVGWLHDARDRFEDALDCFDKALEIAPGHPEALRWRTTALRKLHQYDEAKRSAQKAIELRSGDAGLHAELGLVHDDRLEFETALNCYEAALKLQPEDANTCLARSAALRSLGRFNEAERYVSALSHRYPHSRPLHAELAWILHDERRLNEAQDKCQELLDTAVSGRERSITREGLGWIAFAGGDYGRAEEQFRKALGERQGNLRYKLALAWALTRHDDPKKWQEATQLANDVNERAPDSSAHVCLGVLAFKRGWLASAENQLKKALEIDRYHGSHTDLGALYTHMGRYEEAESELNKSIAQNWYNVTAHVELGAMFLQQGGSGLSKAEQQFREAMAIDASSGPAGVGLAQTLTLLDKDAEAESILRRLIKRQDAEQRWSVYLALARLLIQRGDKQASEDLFAEAYAQAREAIKLAPDREAEPHVLAGIAYYQMGSLAPYLRGKSRSQARAMKHFRDALRREKDNPEANRNIQLLKREMKALSPALWSGLAAAGVSLALLALTWTAFFVTHRISAIMVTSTTPILAGLFVIAAVLPSLIRLKLPGFEAELEAGSGKFSPGPTGEVTFAPGRFTFPTGPTGQVPRHA